MRETRRNIMIGLFVLGGLVALGILVVKFGESPRWLFRTGYVVEAEFKTVSDVREGTEVRLAGVPAGRVVGIALVDRADPTQGVVAALEIREEFTIPEDSECVVVPPLMGQAAIDIMPPAEPRPAVPRDGTGRITGRVVNPLERIVDPQLMTTVKETTSEIGALATALVPAAQALEEILERRPVAETQAATDNQPIPPNLYTTIERLHNVLMHLESVVGDPETKEDFKASIANFRAASEEAKLAIAGYRQLSERLGRTADKADQTLDNVNLTVDTTRERIDRLGQDLIAATGKLSRLLDQGLAVGQSMTEGEGTVALLLRDPKFYEELLFTTQRLREAATELLVLIKQWQKSGLLGTP